MPADLAPSPRKPHPLKISDAQRAAWLAVADAPEQGERLFEHLAAGGTVTGYAEALGTHAALVFRWVHADAGRALLYTAAQELQSEAWRESMRHEVQRLAHARVVGELTLDEIAALREAGTPPLILKASDKLRGLELAGRDLGLFKERIALDVTHTVADKLKAARTRAKGLILEHTPPVAGLLAPIEVEGGGGGLLPGGPPTPYISAQKKSLPNFSGSGLMAPAVEVLAEAAMAGPDLGGAGGAPAGDLDGPL